MQFVAQLATFLYFFLFATIYFFGIVMYVANRQAKEAVSASILFMANWIFLMLAKIAGAFTLLF